MRIKVLASAFLSLGVLAGAGCSSGSHSDADRDLTLDDAKTIAIAVENDIVDLLPNNVIKQSAIDESGVLLSCVGERAYQWASSAEISLTEPIDGAEFITHVIATYEAHEAFTATSKPTIHDEPRAHIIGHHGTGYLVSSRADHSKIIIRAFSPCFILPEDIYPGGDF